MPSPIRAGRAEGLSREWRVTITKVEETPTALLAFGNRGDVPVVLKVFRQTGDERHSVAALQAFQGRGMVEVLDYRDDAEPVLKLSEAKATVDGIPTAGDWGLGYAGYLRSTDSQIDRGLVERGRAWYEKLTDSQRILRLLHGDLHHHNILLDSRRGWVAIDPKGVLGEIEFELGAGFRNPQHFPIFYTAREVVEQRLTIYATRLHLVPERILGRAYAQAVLSAIWLVEDGIPVPPDAPEIQLARTIESILQPDP